MRNKRLYNNHGTLATGLIIGMILLLAGCGSTDPTARYGGVTNSVHDMLGLLNVSQTVLVATQMGLYRSTDQGQTWQEVAGGAGQPMDGLTTLKLAQSSVDPQRVYALAVSRQDDPGAARGQPGVYTSDDAGQTWSLSSPLSALPSQAIFTIGTGSASAGQVFTFLSSQGTYTLYESNDYGAHWKQLPPLPDSSPQGITGISGDAHGLYLWSAANGFYSSSDDGQTWTPATGIQTGINSVTVLGDWLYACGDDGVYVSQDGGAHFSKVYSKTVFMSVVASPDYPQHAYGLVSGFPTGFTASKVMLTEDGGKTWQFTTLPTRIYGTRNTALGQSGISYPGDLAIDPSEPNVVYASFSFPIGVEVTTNNGTKWKLVMP